VAYSQSEPQGRSTTSSNGTSTGTWTGLPTDRSCRGRFHLVGPPRSVSLLAAASVGVFVVFVNALAAALGLLAILFYSVVYTLVLKPHTTQNIVIGG